ncbi:MAG: BolA family transcriptional regulator [Gammaproteobacteria bacterium]|nr:BolA family transcriptional regulator [Gammaproteobacteria bacterium]
MSENARCAQIRATLTAAFSPTTLTVDDQSAQHRGHAGAATGKGHFAVALVAEAFRGRSQVARHRAIYTALASLLETDIHALSIEALSPDECKS